MEKLKELVRRKPYIQLLGTVGFLAVIAFLKWGFTPEIAILTFILGGIAGVYLPDGGELFFRITPSPLNNILFVAAFSVTAIFITTSSTSAVASGMVFAIFIELLIRQIQTLRKDGNLDGWYRLLTAPPPPAVARYVVAGQVILFLLLTLLFTRS